ncbi:MAG TPA: hypothetical protein VNI01_08585, partial [Elusimicrobiota bacterium]|nr:hypothetical protein [Elusimicrobiota bacterium]
STGFAARVDVRQNGMRHSIYWQGADKIQAPVPKMPRSSAVYAAPPRPAPTVQPPTPTVPKAPSAPQVPKPAPVPEAPAAEPSAAVKELRESLDAFNRAMREARLSGREFKPLVLGKLGILPGVLENARELGLSEEEARGYLRLLLMPDAGSGNPLRRLGLTREEAGPYLRVLGAPAASPDLVEKLARLGLPLPASEEELAAARIGRVRLPPNPLEQNTIPLNKGDDFTCSSGETCKGGVCAGCSKMYQVQREELASGRTGAPPAGPRGIDELLRELHTRAQVEDVMSRIADLQGPPDLERQEANKTKFKPSSKINDDAYRDAASLQKDVRSAPQGLRVGVNRWNQDDGQHNHSVVLLAIPGNRDKSMIAVVEPNSILTGPDPARLSGSKYLAIDYTIFTLYGPTERRQTRIRAAD